MTKKNAISAILLKRIGDKVKNNSQKFSAMNLLMHVLLDHRT